MKPTDLKAVRLVTGGRVELVSYAVDADTAHVVRAHGFIEGDSGAWETFILGGGSVVVCDCPNGQNTMNRSHSHDQALRIAAQRQYTIDNEEE